MAKEPTFEETLQELLNTEKAFQSKHLVSFSDLNSDNYKLLKNTWLEIRSERRLKVMEALEDLMEEETIYSFSDVARIALEDIQPKVRSSAIRLLYEEENLKLIPVFIRMMNKDPDAEVRATAAGALGYFVYLGAMEEIPEDQAIRVVDSLVVKMNGDDQPLVRRRALESMGFATRTDVNALIRNSYLTQDPEWVASAIFAMGRSGLADWEKFILNELTNPEPDVQLEAIRAAGELNLESARIPLMKLWASADNLEDEIRFSILTSLGSIGGEGVRELLRQVLEDSTSEDEMEIIEDALEDLDFLEDDQRPLLINFEGLEINDNDATGQKDEDDE